ncbi:MAG: tRNA threonylcarbamoyladenosine dehydratase [Butyrivibrio sp.]|nr:tRNA threonylcarbamoyladenosine dehydratase [Acetatifactor muris]MCM1560331.1 tRNA threonylcarbamoyladenosine dehydratase [Butyrivibrio sp.]
MEDRFERTRLLLGSENMEKLAGARVAVFGLGGVGGYVVEALARCGIGGLDLVDNDVIAPSNLNRQIIATVNTLGKAKAEAARDRVKEINPDCLVSIYKIFYLPETADCFDFREYDYVVDAIDTVTGKLLLAEQAKAAGTPIISSMGTGNKLDPTALKVADIYETRVCPLAKVMRRELRKRGIHSLKVVYSEEEPLCRERPPGSVSFVPSVAGLIIAGEVVKDLLRDAPQA